MLEGEHLRLLRTKTNLLQQQRKRQQLESQSPCTGANRLTPNTCQGDQESIEIGVSVFLEADTADEE